MGLLFVELKGRILVTPHHQQQHYQMNLEPLVIWWSSGDLCLRSHVSLNCRLVNIYSAATAHPDPVRLTLNSLSSKVGIWFFFLIFNCLGFFGVVVGVVMFRESANTWIKWSSDCGVAFLMQSIMHTNSKTYPTLWLSLYFWRSWSNKKLPFSSLFVRPDVTVTQRISLELQRSNPVITAMFLQ